jgi:hypothetical protein
MMWRRLTRAYVGVGAGVGVDVGAGAGVDVGEAVGSAVGAAVGVDVVGMAVGEAVGVGVVGVAVLHPTTSCKTKAVRGLFSKPERARCRYDHRQATNGMPRCAAVRRRRARDRRASPAKQIAQPPMQSANTVRMRTRTRARSRTHAHTQDLGVAVDGVALLGVDVPHDELQFG